MTEQRNAAGVILGFGLRYRTTDKARQKWVITQRIKRKRKEV